MHGGASGEGGLGGGDDGDGGGGDGEGGGADGGVGEGASDGGEVAIVDGTEARKIAIRMARWCLGSRRRAAPLACAKGQHI